MAELYLIIHKDLHQSMETYPQFVSLVSLFWSPGPFSYLSLVLCYSQLWEIEYPAQHQELCRCRVLFFQAQSESFCWPAFEEAN
jgi:hypothetical protein